jgi:hypothetical protein
MLSIRLVLAFAFVFLAACTTPPIGPENATLLTAKNVERGKGASGITDSFTFEGSIFVFATITWETSTSLGTKTFEVRWFNGEKLKFKDSQRATLKQPPWFVYFITNGTALGTGDCRVEIYSDNVLLGTRKFRVEEK